MDRNLIGQQAERQAERFLKTQGLRLVQRNAHCRLGEIDLIMRDGAQIVFIEVRVRKHAHFGGAAASVTPTKQRKIAVTAQLWLSQNPKVARQVCRFDVVAIDSGSVPAECIWYKDAFRPETSL